MTLTDTDLREVLAERASAVPPDGALARVAAVDRRVRVIRRRRVASASLAVVIVLLVVTGVSSLFREPQDRTAPVPAYQQKVAGGLLPRYNGGAEATSYATFRTDEKRVQTFTFTPTSWKFLVAVACDKEMPSTRMVTYEVNGHAFMSGSCGRGPSTDGPSYGLERARAEDLGIRLGRPSTMRVTVVATVKGSPGSAEKQPVYRGPMADYRIAIAVYSPMPVDDYPLPPRPRKLESLDDGGGSYGAGRLLGKVDSRTVGANGHGSVVTTLSSKGLQVDMYAVAPGSVTVTVNGRTVDVASFWTWSGSGYGGLVLTPAALRKLGVDVKSGDSVSVGFAATRFTVAGWRAQVDKSK
jgi:hypothetical protein